MKKVIFYGTVGFVGMDCHEGYLVSDEHWADYQSFKADNYLEAAAGQLALSNAEMYGYYPSEDICLESDLDEEEEEYYVDSIEGHFELYDEDRHAGLLDYIGDEPVFREL